MTIQIFMVIKPNLKEFGLIIDDNVKYHISSKVEVIEQDKKNPRIEIIVEEIEKGN